MGKITQNSTPLNIKDYKKTKELFNCIFAFQTGGKTPELVLTGGAVKGGKSFGAIAIIILLANTYPKSRWVIVRKTNKVIKRNLLPVFDKLEYLCNSNEKLKKIEGDYYKYFNNGSTIILMGENYANDKEGNAFRGLDINGYMLDEGNELVENTWRILGVRNGTNRHTCDIPAIAIITCNPTIGWLKSEVYDKINDGTAPSSWKFIASTPHDNPSNAEQQFETWRNTLSPYDYNRFIKGVWGAEKKVGAFLKEFDPNKHLTAKGIDIRKPVHLSFDENVLPYITCAIWQIDLETKELIQVHELPLKPPDNSAKKAGIKVCEYLTDIGFSEMIFIHGDATSKKKSTLGDTFYNQITDELQNFKVKRKLLRRNESVSITGLFVNEHLLEKYGWKILINEDCGIAISDYTDSLEDQNGGMKKQRITDSVTGLSFEKNGHFTDVLRYFIVSVFFNEYKIFKSKNRI